MLQDAAIDIADWDADYDFEGAYPEGARPKKTIFSPAEPAQHYIQPQWRHMFKKSSGRSSEQYWSEIIAFHIAEMLQVNTPPTYASYDSNTGQCGALSAWFYDSSKESFFPAGHFFSKIIKNFDRDKGLQHNLNDAHRFNNDLFGDSFIFEFWGMMLFDCVIGNVDRHQDNWGHIFTSHKLTKSIATRHKINYHTKLRFAPWFDNGTSLGYEIPPNKFSQWRDDTYDRYIHRGEHHFRYAMDNLTRVNHIDSLKFILKHNPKVAKTLIRKLRNFDIKSLENLLLHFVSLPMPDSGRLSEQRARFILRLTQRRVEIAMESLQ